MSPLFLWDVGPYLGTNPFQGARPFLKKRELFPGPLPTSPGSFALPHWEPCGTRLRHSGFWDLNQTPFRSVGGNGGHRPSLPNGVRPSLRTDWPMFNCCSHGTLLIFGLQSSCLNICYYHQDLHPRRLHPRPRIPRHALLLHLPGGAGETCRWCAPLRGWGIPPEPAGASLHLHCAMGARGHPLTRACIRLLGPCFKTGWVGGRPHRGPRAPFTRAWSPPWLRGAVGDGLRTIRPGQRTCRETQSAFEVSMINVSCNSH